jgi:predicted ATPase
VIGAADVVARFARGTPDVQLLVTSRQPLRVAGELIINVDPLETVDASERGPALELFRSMTEAFGSRISFDGHECVIASEICRLVDGLPLAIELAAARVEALGLSSLRDNLAASTAVLSHGRRDVPQRHVALDATVASARDLLSSDSALVMDCLSAMAAGGSLEQLSSFTDLTVDAVLAAVGELVEHRLIHPRDSPGGARFFAMLRVLRETVWAQLVREGRAAEHQAHVAAYYRALTNRTDGATTRAAERRDIFLRYSDELETIRGVLAWAEARPELIDDAAVLVTNMTTFWWSQNLSEGIAWLKRLHTAATTVGHPADARLLARAAFLSTYGGSSDDAIDLAERALQLCRRRNRALSDVSLCLQILAAAWSSRGASQRALEAVDEGLDIDRSLPAGLRAIHIVNHANVLLAENLVADAESLYRESLSHFRSLGEAWLVAGPLARLGDVALRRGDIDAGLRFFEEARRCWSEGAGATGRARTDAGLARAHLLSGREDEADTLARAAFEWACECGAFGEAPWAIAVHAAVQSAHDRYEDASFLFGSAVLLARSFAQPIHGCLTHDLGRWSQPAESVIVSATAGEPPFVARSTDALVGEVNDRW